MEDLSTKAGRLERLRKQVAADERGALDACDAVRHYTERAAYGIAMAELDRLQVMLRRLTTNSNALADAE